MSELEQQLIIEQKLMAYLNGNLVFVWRSKQVAGTNLWTNQKSFLSLQIQIFIG